MRQVPTFAIIGNGRLARHLSHYFDLLAIPYQKWWRQAPHSLASATASATHVLLLVSDAAIAELAVRPELHGKQLLHCSGALTLPNILGMHPLQTFTNDLYSLDDYQAFAFVIDFSPALFAEIFPQLPNAVYAIPPQSRALYHALCVLAGNYTVLLWQKLGREFAQQFDIPASAWQPYLQQISRNLMTNPSTALTGPLSRGDDSTIDHNLTALINDPYQQVYAAFVKAYREENADAHH